MIFAQKGPNFVCTSNTDQQASYLAMWACEHFAPASTLCTGSPSNAPSSSCPVSAAKKKSFPETTTSAYRIFPGCELKAWSLLLQVTRSHLFPNEIKSFMLWLSSFWQCHHVAIEMYTKLGKEAGLGAVNLLHTPQFGGEEGGCYLLEGSWDTFCCVSLYVPKVHGWALHVTVSGNTNSHCFALLEIYGHKPRRTALYYGTSEVMNVWHNSGVSKLSV